MKAYSWWIALALSVGALPAAGQTRQSEAGVLAATLDHLDTLRITYHLNIEPTPIETAREALTHLSASAANDAAQTQHAKAIEAALDALVSDLHALTPTTPTPIEPQTACGQDAVMCLVAKRTGDGADATYQVESFDHDMLPSSLLPASTIEIRLLVTLDDPGSYAVTALHTAQRQLTFKPSTPIGPATDERIEREGSQGLRSLNAKLQTAIEGFERNALTLHPASTRIDVPTDPQIGRIGLRVTRDGATEFDASLEVDHGDYFFDVGVLIPIAWDASRTLVRHRVEVDDEPRDAFELVTDHDITPAIVISAYPAGRSVGRVGTLVDGSDDDTIWSAFGVQAGLDLLLDEPFDRIYLGGVFEPVSGFGISFGCAFIRREGRPAGLPDDATVDPADTVTPTKSYAPSVYFGVSLSTELVTIGRKLAPTLTQN